MNAFDCFIRFFVSADDGAERPSSVMLPTEAYPMLPVVAGDALRFLVARADVGRIDDAQLSVGIRPAGDSGTGILCGRIRKQAAETYTEIRIRINSAPVSGRYTQFAIMSERPDAAGYYNVMGTFRGGPLTLEDYVEAVQEYYRNYPFALVEVDRTGNELRIRVYPNERLRLNGEDLRIGIGRVLERNENSPSLIAQAALGVSLPAEDRYRVVVTGDIQKGNVYVLDTVTYTASGTERPVDILKALGVAGGELVRTGGASVAIYAQVGSQSVENTNRPALQALYNSTASGNDLYTVIISADVQRGNVYQISAPGSPTKTITAGVNDTKASIEGFFNATSGRYVVPAGAILTTTVVPGYQVRPNTNFPLIELKDRRSKPARTSDVYTVYAGPSVRTGNRFELTIATDTVIVEAAAGDSALTVIEKLGYTGNPFRVEVSPGTVVRAVVRQGARYQEPNDLADVTLISASTYRNLPPVAEVNVPSVIEPGTYQLVIHQAGQVVSESNYLQVLASPNHTALIRYGTASPATVFGLPYAEDGFSQQLRLPIHIDTPMLRQTENLYQTTDNDTVRGRTAAEYVSRLTTRLMPASFHRNLYQALKHPVLYIDDRPYRQEGEYSQTEPQGKRRRMQATASVVALERLDYRPTMEGVIESFSGSYSVIDAVNGLDGLWIALKRLSFVESVSVGLTLPAAEYDLLIRTGADPLRVTVSQQGSRVSTFLLKPNHLNRLGLVRLEPGQIQITGERVSSQMGETALSGYNPPDAVVASAAAETNDRPGDFGPDYSNDFSQA